MFSLQAYPQRLVLPLQLQLPLLRGLAHFRVAPAIAMAIASGEIARKALSAACRIFDTPLRRLGIVV
jgi:hypothetical protein